MDSCEILEEIPYDLVNTNEIVCVYKVAVIFLFRGKTVTLPNALNNNNKIINKIKYIDIKPSFNERKGFYFESSWKTTYTSHFRIWRYFKVIFSD